MNFATPKASHNRLLSLLPPAEMGLLRPHLTHVHLVNGQTLHEAGEPIGQVFFVGRGYVSMVSEADGDEGGTEVGLIGRESMVGLPVLLGPGAASFSRAMVQSPGEALRLSAQVLHDDAGRLPVLRRLLSQALEVFMAQVAQTAACNSRHMLAQRLARWLLMAHDRVDGDELTMRQEFLSIMLRRPPLRRDARLAGAGRGGRHPHGAEPRDRVRPPGPGGCRVRLLWPRQGVRRGGGRQKHLTSWDGICVLSHAASTFSMHPGARVLSK